MVSYKQNPEPHLMLCGL